MKRTRFTEERIIGILQEHQAGLGAQAPCRKQGISDATFYEWRARLGAMEVPGAWRLKALETEHAKLEKMLTEQMMDLATLGKTGMPGLFSCAWATMPITPDRSARTPTR